MSEIPLWEDLISAGLESEEAFRNVLRKALTASRLDTREFCRRSGISESSLYKLLSGQRVNPRLSTFRRIVKAFQKLQGVEEGDVPFIAIIAARPTLDAIETRSIQVGEQRIQLREYAAMSMEEVIVATVRAQQEGARAIVCAPIVSTTVEKIARIPVSACPVIQCKQPILKAAEIAATKVLLE